MSAKDKKNRGASEDESDQLIVTLPDGRHRTNLSVLIRTKEARQHFKEISEVVESEKKKALKE